MNLAVRRIAQIPAALHYLHLLLLTAQIIHHLLHLVALRRVLAVQAIAAQIIHHPVVQIIVLVVPRIAIARIVRIPVVQS
ncbi:MAG: hypothetical protein LBE20_06300 [Deltaproteobacteria bacterium]|nr:hypothetical protein [Deltaproteobacteria bacterium]